MQLSADDEQLDTHPTALATSIPWGKTTVTPMPHLKPDASWEAVFLLNGMPTYDEWLQWHVACFQQPGTQTIEIR